MARDAYINGRLFGKNWTPPKDQDSLTTLKEIERLAEELFDEYSGDFIDGFTVSVLERNL